MAPAEWGLPRHFQGSLDGEVKADMRCEFDDLDFEDLLDMISQDVAAVTVEE